MKDFFKNLKFTWKYAKSERISLIVLIIISLINIMVNIIMPVLSAKIIISLTNSDFYQIIAIAIVIFLIGISSTFFHYIIRMCSINIYRNTLTKLGMDLGKNVLKLENSCMDDKGSGLFIQRLTNDTTKMADVFNYVLNTASQIIRNIGVLIAIFIINKIVFIYVFVSLVIIYFVEKKRTIKRNEDDKISRKASEAVSGFIGELIRGARDIKMLNSEKDFLAELRTKIEDANDKKMSMQRTSWKYKLVAWQIMDYSSLVLIILLVMLMKRNIIVSAIALVIYNYADSLPSLIYFIDDLLEYVKDFNLSCERIYEIIDSKDFKKEVFGTRHLDKLKGNFEFQNVTFGYNEKIILNKLNFKIKANETIAFVGKSGAGKTTIFSLICKMYNINSGDIKFDGISINELDKDTIRGNITIISQNPYIFNLSIKDNLRLVKSNLTDSEMKKACKIACLNDFIKGLPDGYDTIIGEGGVNLSGGQKQRLAIARALVQKTEIILFDEATSALDNETQKKIAEAINNMKQNYTILIIAHRLSTIISADRILYLENGKIESSGKHEELLKKCDKYKKLYESELIKKD